MDDVLSLGTETATWAIKDFSVSLRQQITQAARRHDCTVAEWVHGHFQRHGVDDQQFDPVKIGRVNPPSFAASGDLAELRELATLARALTPEGKDGRDSEALRLARSLVCDRLRALRKRPTPPLMIGADDK